MPEHPPRITRIVAEKGLGDIVERFRQPLGLEISYLIVFFGMGVLGLIFGDGLGRIFGAVVLVLASLIASEVWFKARRFLYLCSDGLLTTKRGTRVTNALAWRDVASIRIWSTRIYDPGSPGWHEDFGRCVLERKDGSRLNLARPPYVDGERLAARVEQAVAPMIHKCKVTELASTHQASFGRIVLTETGLRDGDRFAGFSEITRIKRGRVRLRIWTGSRRPTISRQIRTTPNATVLLAMVAELSDHGRAS